LTRTAVVMRSAHTVVSATRRSSAAMDVQTANAVERQTETFSAPGSRRAGRSRRARPTVTAVTATSARCTTTSATRSASTTCRSAAVSATGSAVGPPGVGCGRRRGPGHRASDGGPCSLDRVASHRGPSPRRHPATRSRPTQCPSSCENSAQRRPDYRNV